MNDHSIQSKKVELISQISNAMVPTSRSLSNMASHVAMMMETFQGDPISPLGMDTSGALDQMLELTQQFKKDVDVASDLAGKLLHLVERDAINHTDVLVAVGLVQSHKQTAFHLLTSVIKRFFDNKLIRLLELDNSGELEYRDDDIEVLFEEWERLEIELCESLLAERSVIDAGFRGRIAWLKKLGVK